MNFQGFGQSMYEKKGVNCVDCHMADLPSAVAEGGDYESHTWKVEDNIPYSCGTGDSCHHNKTAEWAMRQIEKMKIHGKK